MNITAYADEFGNSSFDFDKQGTHFIVASVIIDEQDAADAEEQLNNIRTRYFQTGEIKSNKIAGDHRRRSIILNEIVKLDFTIYAVIVDKQHLVGEGFKYKKSFYKFLNSLVYRELFSSFKNMRLVVDEHGSNEFMRQFKTYVTTNHIPTLFGDSVFLFKPSASCIQVQLADLIAGTLGYCFDETKKSESAKAFLEILFPKIISLKNFPSEKFDFNVLVDDSEKIINSQISEIGVTSARHFIDKYSGTKNQDEIDQVNCVKLLLLYFNYNSSAKYVATKEIIRHLNVGRIDKLNEHSFRTKIVGKIRDAGVLVVSSSSGEKSSGYKLPATLEDLYKYINHGKSVILPMLKRIKIFRDKIKLASNNEIDIVNKKEFHLIRNMIDLKI
jgi:hypothetical protein